jgi:hypothetical protein
MKKDPKRRKQIALDARPNRLHRGRDRRIDRRFKRSIVVRNGHAAQSGNGFPIAWKKREQKFLDDRERDNAELRPNKKLHKEKRHYPVRKEKRHWRGGEE